MSLLSILIQWPWLALLPAAAFGGLYVRGRRRWVLVATLAWLMYFGWEFALKMGFGCPTGGCNIRVDLLIIYPSLLLLSVVAVVATLRTSRED